MGFVYNLAYFVFGVFYAPFFSARLVQAEDPKRLLAERRGLFSKELLDETARHRIVWIHAVSVGEVMAVRNFALELLAQAKDVHLLITTVTPTGQKIAEGLRGPRVSVAYAPFDFSWVCRRFLEAFKPVAIFLVETEIWPNFLCEAEKKGVPVGIVNGRLSKRSTSRYGAFKALFKPLFEKLSFAWVQTEEDAAHYIALGVPVDKVRVLGNLKLDEIQEAPPENAAGAKAVWGIRDKDPVIVAGSTHLGEEEMLARAFLALRRDFPGLKLVIAPRHIERSEKIQQSLRALGLATVRASELKSSTPLPAGNQNSLHAQDGMRPSFSQAGLEVIVLDQLGILKRLYRMADAVFVGGSLIPHGGQNPVEAVCFRKGVLHGPHVFNFEKIYRSLDQAGGARLVRDRRELEGALRELLASEKKRVLLGEEAFSALLGLRGALRRHLEAAQEFLSLEERNRNTHVNSQLFSQACGRS